MKILISPGLISNAKSYPYWDELIKRLSSDHEIKTIDRIMKEWEIIDWVEWCDVWISIDSFLQHLAKYKGLKPGIVIWGTSDPLIFGYPTNTNLLKSRDNMRPDQFLWWKDEQNRPEVFVSPKEVKQAIDGLVDSQYNFGNPNVIQYGYGNRRIS